MSFRVVVLSSALLAGGLLAQPAADPASVARKSLDAMLAAKYSDASQAFTPDMKTAYPEASMGGLGARIKSFGALQKIDDPTVQKIGPNTIVVLPAHFANENINFRYIVNQNGQIAGMFLLPGAIAWHSPAYSKPGAFTERAVTVGTDWKLPGTLTVPAGAGPFPGVVLVQDSGPHDRDETVYGNKVFRDLAEGLSSRGIVVLRYDNRRKVYPARTDTSGFTVEQEAVDDAVQAAAVLRQQKEVAPKRVYLVGHGLGGYVAPRIAVKDGKLAGIVLLAANVRPLEDLMVQEAVTLGLPANQVTMIKAAAAKVKGLEQQDSDAPPILGRQVSYWLDLKGYDPSADAAKLSIPILILQGERDFQVPMQDFAMWKTALASHKNATLKSFPALNHIFVAGEGKSTAAEYQKAGHVDPQVIQEIAAWVGK